MIKLKDLFNEAKSDYAVYHKTYTSAINTAREYAEKKGYEIDDDDAFRQIDFLLSYQKMVRYKRKCFKSKYMV